MKTILILLVMLAPAAASASLITYAYTSRIENPTESHEAVGLFTVDDQRRGLVSASFVSEPVNFEWEGFVPLMYEQPVSSVGQLYENGFHRFESGRAACFLYLDLFFLDAGEDIFHNLDRTAPFEGANVENLDTGTTYWFIAGLTKVRTVDVPEPSPLLLSLLGVVALATRKVLLRRRKA
ncbi:hypothetical protein [Marinobacter bohaiensis]|uniref:hypothetical protein n=1 Tax=Marinobacter bohaiensis TaxID=2201898 RepID=UPI000DACD1F7|nr:hypothetical protein [Marinobacter bohaiensis]